MYVGHRDVDAWTKSVNVVQKYISGTCCASNREKNYNESLQDSPQSRPILNYY